jgi:hypothetical protein
MTVEVVNEDVLGAFFVLLDQAKLLDSFKVTLLRGIRRQQF